MPSDLADEDILLRQAARGQSDIFPSLVEATFSRAWTVMGGSRGGVLFVYRSMRDHLDEVDSRTRFWDWFTQIAAIPRIRTASDISVPEVPPGALAELLESLEGSAAPRSSGLFTRLVRLHLSGWLTAFSVSMILTFLIVDRGEGPAFHIGPAVALVPTTAIIAATMSSLLLGPWLSRRHQILNLLLLFPVSVAASLFAYSSIDRFASGSLDLERAAKDGLTLLLGHDLIPCAVAAVVVTYIGGILSQLRSWVNNRSRTSWRKLLSILTLCSLLGWIGYRLGPTVVGGWKLAPEILAADPTLYSPSPVRSYDLPKTFTHHPAILHYNEFGSDFPRLSFEKLESARTVWLQHVRQNWTAPGDQANSPILKRYVFDVDPTLLASPENGGSVQQVEIAVRMALIDPGKGGRILGPWSEMSHGKWQSLADLAASTEWRPCQIDQPLVWSEFQHFAVTYEQSDPLRLETGQSIKLGQSLIEWYRLQENRSRLNDAAQTFRQILPLLTELKKPLTAEIADKIQQFSWGIHHSSVLYEALYDENARRNTAELALRLELKNLQANGEPQPKQPSDLRPPFNDIAETYADWFTLEKLWAELSPAK